MTHHRPRAGFALVTLLAAVAAGSGAARAGGGDVAAGLLPHRAVYDMHLGDADDSASIQGVAGRIVTEFTGSVCDGFTTSFRFVSRISDQDGGTRLTDLRTTSFETADGGTFQFVTQNYVDQVLTEETKGVATRGPADTVVDLVKPAAKQVTLKGEPLFPTQHIIDVIAAAAAGRTILTAPLYDGGETGEKLMLTTAVIGQPAAGDDAPAEDDGAMVAKLGGARRWPVRLSYFDANAPQGEQTPLYEISFLLYESGISRRLVLDYGDFTIIGRLSSLELLPTTPCEQ